MTTAVAESVSGIASLSAGRDKAIIPVLGFLAAIQGVDPNIASTALVGASRGLQMSPGTVSLAASISTLALAATAITSGVLADRLGRRRVLLAGLFACIIGDLMTAVAPAPFMYLAGRIIVGLGFGAVYGAAFALIRFVRTPRQFPAAMGIFTAVLAITAITFTFVGGALAGISWRIAFLVVPFLCAIGVALTVAVVPVQPRVGVGLKADVAGQLLLGGAIVGLLFGCSRSGGGLLRPDSGGALLLGVVLLLGFVIWESRYAEHFFPLEVLRKPLFFAAVCAGFVYNFTNAIVFLQLANLWQYLLKLGAMTVSLWELPFLFSGIAGAVIFGRLMKKGTTNRRALLVSGISTASGLMLLALARDSDTLMGFLPGIVLAGFGCMVASLPYGNLIIQVAPTKYFGPVTSSRTTFGQFFYAAGLALGTVFIDGLTKGGTVSRLKAAGVPPSHVGAGLDAVSAYATKGTKASTELGQKALGAAAPAYVAAFGILMVVTAVLVLIASVIGAYLLRHETTVATSSSEI
ncbi:MAG: MFS transporter [Microthrixaceae bacterium]